MNDRYSNVLKYYTEREFNPVPIALENQSQWETQIIKRVNLLQNHLGIPVHLLKDKEVLEVGCNSGENALVLAHFGARLTLAEPNEQVHSRLQNNFTAFGLNHQIKEIYNYGLDDLELDGEYDLVIAEGFLNTLPNKDKLLIKLLGLCKDNGFLIINYDDRYGGYLELLKSCILKRICFLENINFRSPESLKFAKILYEESFNKLKSSRSLAVWWEDQLVNPYASCIWSLNEILGIAEKKGFYCYSNSPSFPNHKMFKWYKDVSTKQLNNTLLSDNWRDAFAYILTGNNNGWKNFISATMGEVEAIHEHTQKIARFIANDDEHIFDFEYPEALKMFLNKQNTSYHTRLSIELNQLYNVLQNNSVKKIMKSYNNSELLKDTWGTLLHYACLMKI